MVNAKSINLIESGRSKRVLKLHRTYDILQGIIWKLLCSSRRLRQYYVVLVKGYLLRSWSKLVSLSFPWPSFLANSLTWWNDKLCHILYHLNFFTFLNLMTWLVKWQSDRGSVLITVHVTTDWVHLGNMVTLLSNLLYSIAKKENLWFSFWLSLSVIQSH